MNCKEQCGFSRNNPGCQVLPIPAHSPPPSSESHLANLPPGQTSLVFPAPSLGTFLPHPACPQLGWGLCSELQGTQVHPPPTTELPAQCHLAPNLEPSRASLVHHLCTPEPGPSTQEP